MKIVDPYNQPLNLVVRQMRDSARRGDTRATMEHLRQVEGMSGASLAMSPRIEDIDRKIKDLQTKAGTFWMNGSQTLPNEKWNWNDPVAVFCCQVIPLLRAASSSGEIDLIQALADHGVDVGAMEWTQVTGPAIMQRKASLLEWAVAQGADPTGKASGYRITMNIEKWSDMNQAPLLFASQRSWKQGVLIMMGDKWDPEAFWPRTKPAIRGQARQRWMVAAAGDAEMAKWLLGRHEGRISSVMEQRMLSEISNRARKVGDKHWLKSRAEREGIEGMVRAMTSRQRLRAGAGEPCQEEVAEVSARPMRRM